MAFKPKLVPTLFTIPALIALLGLGIWQLQRMEWKETLLDRLQSRAETAAVDLPAGPLSEGEWEFRRVEMTGRFRHDDELHLLNRSLNGNPGLHVFTPFERTDMPGKTVLVNRGWVPFERKDKNLREQGLIEGEVTVNGILRFEKPVTTLQRVFLPENEPQNNIWYAFNHEQMGREIEAEVPDYYVVDGNESVPGTYPVGRQWSLDIRNDHLQYALTWFSLAIALAVIYVLFHRRKEESE